MTSFPNKGTALIAGFSSTGACGILAERLGREGFSISMIASSKSDLAEAKNKFAQEGIRAEGFELDLADTAALGALITRISAELGPIAVVVSNAHLMCADDLGACSLQDLSQLVKSFEVSTVALLTIITAARVELERNHGAVIVFGGVVGFNDEQVHKFANFTGMGGSSIIKAALLQTTGLLHHKLAPRGVFVGSVNVTEAVKGTAFDDGTATLEAAAVADAAMDLYLRRPTSEWSVRVPDNIDLVSRVAAMADVAASQQHR